MSTGPRYTFPDPKMVAIYGLERCLDCGSLIYTDDKPAHTRFHSILSGHAWAIAVLKNAHIAARVHNQYAAYERIDSKRFDSWSADALAEVTESLAAEPEENEAGT